MDVKGMGSMYGRSVIWNGSEVILATVGRFDKMKYGRKMEIMDENERKWGEKSVKLDEYG